MQPWSGSGAVFFYTSHRIYALILLSKEVVRQSVPQNAPYLRLNRCKYTPRDASGRKGEWLKTQQIQGFANLC